MFDRVTATLDNIVMAEAAGIEGLLAYSPTTGEEFPVSIGKFSSIWRAVMGDRPVCDREGKPMILAMGTPACQIVSISDDVVAQALNELAEINEVFDILEDYLALDRLERRGYFNG